MVLGLAAGFAPAPPLALGGRGDPGLPPLPPRLVRAGAVRIFWGGDAVAMEAAAGELRAGAVSPELQQLNYERSSKADADALALGIQALATEAFGGGGRMLWLSDNDHVARACSKDTKAMLERDLPMVPASSVLLITSAKKPHASWIKALEGAAGEGGFVAREFPLAQQWEDQKLLSQVEAAAARAGVRLTPEAAEELVEATLGNTGKLQSELQKLLPLQEAGGEIGLEAVRALAPESAGRQGAKRLTEAVARGDPEGAAGAARSLVEVSGDSPLQVLAILVTAVRGWLWVQAAGESRENPSDGALATAMGLKNAKRLYFVRREAEGKSVEKLREAVRLLHDAELAMKGGDIRAGGRAGLGLEPGGGALARDGMLVASAGDSARLVRAVAVELCALWGEQAGRRGGGREGGR